MTKAIAILTAVAAFAALSACSSNRDAAATTTTRTSVNYSK